MTDTTFGHLTEETLALFTDLYELRMMQAAFNQGHNPNATFSLFVRDLPKNRGYAVAAGLEQAIQYVETLEFGERALAFLTEQGFDEGFLEHLADFEFSGEIRALPEGTPVFANEPLLEVTAPLLEAQLLETALINQVGYQSLIATKASRMRDVIDRRGDDQRLVDFGSRRAHGTDAGIKAARAAYVGGFDATSNVAAGEAFGVPVSGTMAHSWVQSFERERESFETFVDEYGDESVLLIDTYDTVRGAEIARDVAAASGVDLAGVRLDSGDLAALSRDVDEIIPDVDKSISSGIDEYAIADFFERDGVADGFGPGTALVTSTDAPAVEGVYKLVAVERDGEMRPTMKLSAGKVTYPGAKSVRRTESDGRYAGDVLGLCEEDCPGTELLVTVLEDGERVVDLPALETIRERARERRRKLPERHRRIDDPDPYEVRISDGLQRSTEDLRETLESRVAADSSGDGA
ncbi:nicotinate phosphoribosyltransferase [Natronolimnohabitans innermongolicus]|uniref:nicotinate phosphoribosyltransferase n=1 Tax=Natronolimnohabitans innermongolicus JCM 12255 TaxID=1227499 RepID=L9XDJ6_9EURY|nr:nicotinate phosphoribosyltransferase [Natronolimnohabitans innermongolicus]ELY58698.1 nicotinate phosphoribosyltransferase [Natronolimnohabitans innermongolicus JCM 12255]